MASINAKRAAQKVSETVRKGKKVVLGEILKEVGYSNAVANSPQRVTETKTYQETLAIGKKSTLEMLEMQIAKIQAAIAKKNLDDEDYRTLVGSLDIAIKNKQLLSGGATERKIFILPSEVMTRNLIEQKAPDELPEPSGTSNTLSAHVPEHVAEGSPDVPADLASS